MTLGLEFDFAGASLVARGTGCLWWPGERYLIVSDLHLGKAERMARRGGALLPPFETQDTLTRLLAEIQALGPSHVVSLGDTFDDSEARAHLSSTEARLFDKITQQAEWIAISGNHDRQIGQPELKIGAITLRHIAGEGPDISGHFHPKITIAGQRRAAFLCHPFHLLLPAFGTYTGGLDIAHEALAPYTAGATAILTGPRPIAIPARKARIR